MAEANYLQYLLTSVPEYLDEFNLMQLEKHYKNIKTLAEGCSYGAMVNAVGDLAQSVSDVADDMADHMRKRTMPAEVYTDVLGKLDAFWESVPGVIEETLIHNCACKGK